MAKRTRRNGEGSIFPYRNGFAAYVWVTRPDGTRTRKYVYGKTREEVHDKWITLHKKAKEGPVATKVPTVNTYVEYWLTQIVKPNLAPGSYTNYEAIARLYIKPGLGGKRVDKMRTSDVQTWINAVAASCQCCIQGKDTARPTGKRRCCAIGACCEQYPSAVSLRHIRAVLRAILSQAITDEYLTRNVAQHVKLPPIRSRRRKAWLSEEARRFLESAWAAGDPLYAAYVLVLVLGLRKGELLGLTWDVIDWAGWDLPCPEHGKSFCPSCQDNHQPALQVERQLQRVGHELLHRDTKTPFSDAGIPLPAICATALRHHQLVTEAKKNRAGEAWQDTGFLFTATYGTPLEPRNFNRYWDRRCAAANIRRITVRDARRTCASLLADLDIHPRVAMQILRHAQFSITMEIYTEVSSEKTREALKRLGASLQGPRRDTTRPADTNVSTTTPGGEDSVRGAR